MFDDGRGEKPPRPFRLEDIDPAGLLRLARLILGGIALLVIFLGLGWAIRFYADWLWFTQLGYANIILKVVWAKAWLFIFGLLAFGALAGLNALIVFRRTGGPLVSREFPSSFFPSSQYQRFRQLLGWASVGVIFLLSFFFASAMASQWENILRYLSGVPFEETDPIFAKDLGFYVFSLPVLQLFQGWLLGAIILGGVIAAGLYYVIARLQVHWAPFGPRGRSHLLVLGALAFIVVAAGHWLGRYDLLYSTAGAVYGVGYTEAHANIPIQYVMTAVALFAAALLIASIFSDSRGLILWAVGLWIGISVVANGVIPGFVQRFRVVPNELARESPYLAHHIQLTRRAYGLDRITSRSHPARGEVEAETIARHRATVQNIRLWDEGPLLQSYNQIQFFRLYYDFVSVTTDRYMIDGELRQVMLSARELSAEKLPSEAQRWVNRHLQFTHGYGVAMSPVTEVTMGGRPGFYLSNVPPQGKIPLERPEIYYGLKTLPYLIVNTGMQEFNYPGAEGPVYTRYEGSGGVPLSSRLRRLLYSWYFGDVNIVISEEIQPQSRIQYRRNVTERVLEIAPFLIPDRNPYTVVADGKLFWIQDAYTTTNRFPYSEPWQRRFNYIRNSVKVVVNAYDGSVDFYVADPDDPLIQTYAEIFPGVFKPLDEIPEYLKPHLRYPQDLFSIQVQMLLQYHMNDPTVFYNKEDQWDLPRQTAFGETSILMPYYIVARLPGEQREEFILLQPFTPVNRHNLVAWIAARSDAPHYGELVLFRFPSGRHVDGPNQIEARIDNDAIISEQFTLWGQVGSEVSRGILLVIPLGESILYAEPVFLRPEALDFPELRRIILADSRQVVMHPTLEQAVRALVGELPAVAPVETEGGEPVMTEGRAPPSTPRAAPPAPQVRGQEIEAIKEEVRRAQQQLESILKQLDAITQPENGQ